MTLRIIFIKIKYCALETFKGILQAYNFTYNTSIKKLFVFVKLQTDNVHKLTDCRIVSYQIIQAEKISVYTE